MRIERPKCFRPIPDDKGPIFHALTWKTRGVGSVVLCALMLTGAACDESSSWSDTIYLVAEPAGVERGQTVSVILTSNEPFFNSSAVLPVESDGGLVLESIEVQTETSALATFDAEAAAPGLHELEIEMGRRNAQLKMSVLMPPPGPGTAFSNDADATAGAHGATLTIQGNGTRFDSRTEVYVEGADGFRVNYVEVFGPGLMYANYDIDLSQKPMVCTVVIIDGMLRYEIPFTVLSPPAYENQAGAQHLTKGREGMITLLHSDAVMHFGTYFEVTDERVQSGSADVASEAEVRIPVRVPVDYPGDTLQLTAWSFSHGGAYLETLTTDVTLHEPGYIGFVPSVLDIGITQHSVSVASVGVDLTDAQSLGVEKSADLYIVDWQANAADEMSVTFAFTTMAQNGAFMVSVDDGTREIFGLVAGLLSSGTRVYGSREPILQGDRTYFPLLVTAETLTEDTQVLGNGDVEVHGLYGVDENCIVVDLEVAVNAAAGVQTLTINNEGNTYYVDVHVAESDI